MKKNILFAMMILAVLPQSYAQDSLSKQRQARTKQVESFYQQAEQAFVEGDLKAAQEGVRAALAINPNHGPSYALRLKLKSNGDRFKVENRKRQFKNVILPVVDIEEMTVSEALALLSKLIEKQTEDKFHPNFVITDRQGSLEEKVVTLQLKNIPASIALQYLLESAGATARYDQYATTIQPRDVQPQRSATPQQ